MARSRRLLVALTGLVLSVSLAAQTGMTAQAGSNRNYLDSLNGGVAAILDPSATNTTETAKATVRKYSITEEEPESTRVMANVKKALNLRSEANENAEKVGKLYKDCGGTILERKDGWTRLQSGNVIGWAKDEYLLFGDDAEALYIAAKIRKMLDDKVMVSDGKGGLRPCCEKDFCILLRKKKTWVHQVFYKKKSATIVG